MSHLKCLVKEVMPSLNPTLGRWLIFQFCQRNLWFVLIDTAGRVCRVINTDDDSRGWLVNGCGSKLDCTKAWPPSPSRSTTCRATFIHCFLIGCQDLWWLHTTGLVLPRCRISTFYLLISLQAYVQNMKMRDQQAVEHACKSDVIPEPVAN